MSDITLQLTQIGLAQTLEESELNEKILRNLTREIAMDIRPIDDVLASFGVTLATYNELCQRPYFIGLLREQVTTWHGNLNVENRIKAKMQSMVEEALPDLYKELTKEGLTTAKVELVKTLMKGGNIGAVDKDIGGAEKVQITINMGAEKTVTMEQPLTIDHDAEEAA